LASTDDAGTLIGFETGLLDGNVVVSDWKVYERIETLTVRLGLIV
jgi:hypothetical protein